LRHTGIVSRRIGCFTSTLRLLVLRSIAHIAPFSAPRSALPAGISAGRRSRDWRRSGTYVLNTHSPQNLRPPTLPHPVSIIFKTFAMSATLDMSTLQPFYAAPILLIVGYLLYTFVFRDKRRKYMPPLVPGPPLLNHTLIHLEPEFPWKLVKWAQDYGPIYRTKSAATDFIWLGSPMAIKDIIDRRSAIYSSRQPLPMSSDVASGGRRLTLMPKGNKWRTIRTIIHRVRAEFEMD